jgi:putative transposase
MKQRNPIWGCPRIAQQIALAFGVPINKDVVRRILAARYRSAQDSPGPSWLTVLGHTKDSLWSLDVFRCGSAVLRTQWVLVVPDQCTRRIVGFGVHRGDVDGVGLCRMFNRATRDQSSPTYLSSDHDPLYQASVFVRDRLEFSAMDTQIRLPSPSRSSRRSEAWVRKTNRIEHAIGEWQ